MGIRYDRDSRRTTNGPMIFFSIMKDEAFEEEIRSAYLSGLSFYAYRFPHDTMMSYGSTEGYVEGLGVPGFVIGFFTPDLPVITIPYDGKKRSEKHEIYYEMPYDSTSRESYAREVRGIIDAIKSGKGEKVVAARVIVKEEKIDIAEKYYSLCQRFPECFVFCFSTPATGCWIGASPELLLSAKEEEITTMALAGTREAGTEGPWDSKNIEEQQIVVRYIKEKFEEAGLKPMEGVSTTKEAGIVEHICTPISAVIPQGGINIEGLLKSLSPTPALCGSPKSFALEEIRQYEDFDRGCYGGFCGPYHFDRDFTFNVVLRCASVSEKRLCIYVGGGITGQSEEEKEWLETELKSSIFTK